MQYVALFWVVLLGLCFGSFVNALVWRIKNKKDFVRERSICVHCKHVLAWYDLVPLFSWLQLRGKCRYCRKPIDDSPLVELATTLLFVGSYVWWPMTLAAWGEYLFFAMWLLQATGLVALAVYDLKWMLLPNKILYPMTILAVIMRFVEALFISGSLLPLREMLLGMVVGGGFFWLIFQISSGRWIGGGDVKLGFYMGALLNPASVLLAIMLSFYIASAYLLPMMLVGKVSRKSKIPFGPFLIVGLIIMILFGANVTDLTRALYGLPQL